MISRTVLGCFFVILISGIIVFPPPSAAPLPHDHCFESAPAIGLHKVAGMTGSMASLLLLIFAWQLRRFGDLERCSAYSWAYLSTLGNWHTVPKFAGLFSDQKRVINNSLAKKEDNQASDKSRNSPKLREACVYLSLHSTLYKTIRCCWEKAAKVLLRETEVFLCRSLLPSHIKKDRVSYPHHLPKT
jgi:hypothetical protein